MAEFKLDTIQTNAQETLWWILNIVNNNPLVSAEVMRNIGIDVPDTFTDEMLIAIAREEALRDKRSQAQLRNALFSQVPIIHDDLPEEFYESIAVLNHEADRMRPRMLTTTPNHSGNGGNGGQQGQGGINVKDISMWGSLASGIIGTIGSVLGAHQNNGQNGNQPPNSQPPTYAEPEQDDEVLGVSKTTVMWGAVVVAIVVIGGAVALYFNAKEERELRRQLAA